MFWKENFPKRSQDLEEAFHDVGQFYWERVGAKKNDIAFGRESIPIKIPRYLVQDIDTMEDWVRAEMMYEVLEKKDLF
jgi:CMP-N-acetylneuraminic acid synthetase